MNRNDQFNQAESWYEKRLDEGHIPTRLGLFIDLNNTVAFLITAYKELRSEYLSVADERDELRDKVVRARKRRVRAKK